MAAALPGLSSASSMTAFRRCSYCSAVSFQDTLTPLEALKIVYSIAEEVAMGMIMLQELCG